MVKRVEIENIEELRRLAGIEDVELREAIRSLRVGDHVRLTLLSGARSAAGQTVLVRITRINGPDFRGKLADRPPPPGIPGLKPGSPLAFTAAHIHSLPERRLSHAP